MDPFDDEQNKHSLKSDEDTLDGDKRHLRKVTDFATRERTDRSMITRLENSKAGRAFDAGKRVFDAVQAVSDDIEKTPFFKSAMDSIDAFLLTSTQILPLIDEVARLHPIIQVAVLPFKALLKLRLKQKENEKKITLVLVKIQETVQVILRLGDVKDPSSLAGSGRPFAGYMHLIGEDIKVCGNAFDDYYKKHSIIKAFKSYSYDDLFTDFVSKFNDWQIKVEREISSCTLLVINKVNQTSKEMWTDIRALKDLFHKLVSRQDKERIDYIRTRQAAMQDDYTILQDLLSKQKFHVAEQDLAQFKHELQEDLETSLKVNMETFSRKMKVQSEELKNLVTREATRVIGAVQNAASGARFIKDPDLYSIWDMMGWKGSVKARHFVLSLHDYFSEKLSIESDSSVTSQDDTSTTCDNIKVDDDRWALPYIDIMGVQPILETIDDDATGFVSISEANTFTATKPDDWSLPAWLAYWAKGWRCFLWIYRLRICGIVQQMYSLLENDSILPCNRQSVHQYLDGQAFCQLQLLLRSIGWCYIPDSPLLAKAQLYIEQEEQRLKVNIETFEYVLDAPDIVLLVTGPGRIERHLLPLLYILLQRHLRIIKASCTFPLVTLELPTASESLDTIFGVVDVRIDNLIAIFRQTNYDAIGRLGNFAFGMFQFLHHDHWHQRHSKETVQENIFSKDMYAIVDDSPDEGDDSALHYGKADDVLGLRTYVITIIGSRLVCLQCTTIGLGNQIDLCMNCIDETLTTDDRGEHCLTHDLVKFKTLLHLKDKADFYKRARKTADRASSLLRSGIDDTGESTADETSPAKESLMCTCCKKTVSPPCWLCVDCQTFICDDCDAKERSDEQSHHIDTHPVIKIRPDPISEESENIENRLRRMLEARLAAMEANVDQRLTKMEVTLETILRHITAEHGVGEEEGGAL